MNQQFMGLNTRSLIISGVIGGVVMGILTNIPLVNCLNCLLGAWIWGSGIGAVWLYRQSQKQAVVTNTQGLALGAAAGIVGAIVGGIAAVILGGLNAAFWAFLGNLAGSGIGDTVQSFLVSSGFQVLVVIRNIFVYGIVGAIGGLIATALIWKAPAPMPPYTPPPAAPTP